MFAHEKFGAYQAAIDFVALATTISIATPRGHSELLDQLKRAANSIALNIAEGSGRNSQTEKKRFYSIARGSALECVAILDVLIKLTLIDEKTRTEGRTLLNSVVAILTSICRPTPNPAPK